MKTTAYTPRRASKTRWLQSAPEFILDCFDDPREPSDRYTILLTGSQLGRMGDSTEFRDTYVMAIIADEEGRACWHEFNPWDASVYRFRNGKRRVRWLDLPEAVRREVEARCKPEPARP